MNPQDSGSPPPILFELLRRLHAGWPLQRFADVTCLIAVSGGADSVALLRLLHASLETRVPDQTCGVDGSTAPRFPHSGRLLVAHFNHGLRGADSDADEEFVRDLCGRLQIECIVGRANRPATTRRRIRQSADNDPASESTAPRNPADSDGPELPGEASLRAERYAFLDRTAHQRGARYVATAHTADDQVETVLHQMFRGSGPLGLAGMPRFRDLGEDAVLVRPLLDISKPELRNLLQALEQPWREDASNAATHWQRNWLRGCLLPEIRTRYGEADQAIVRAVRTQQAWVDDLRGLARDWATHALKLAGESDFPADLPPPKKGEWLLIDHRAAPATLQRRSILIVGLMRAWDRLAWPRGQMTQAHWDALAELIEATEPITSADNVTAENATAESDSASGEAAAQAPTPAAPTVHSLNLPGNLRARLLPPAGRAIARGYQAGDGARSRGAPSTAPRFVVVERLSGD